MKIPVPLLLLLLVPVITAGCGSTTGKDSVSSHDQAAAGAFPDCSACHSSKQPTFDPTLTNSTGTEGKHVTHVDNRNIACVRCHLNYTDQATHMNGTMDTPSSAGLVFFDSANPNGQWVNDSGPQKGSCSSLVCHGTDIPDWYGTGWTMPNCATCHVGSLDPLATNGSGTDGKHLAHVTDSGFTCLKCHSSYISQSSHMNGAPDTPNPSIHLVSFDSLNPIGQWINDTGSQTGSCSNVYCHSIVQTATGGPLTLNSSGYKTPTWYGGLDANCTDCHGYPSASGSHLKHAGSGTGQYAFTCEQCHSGYVLPNATATHADGAINTAIKATWGGTYNGDTTPGNGFSNCANTYCHGDGTSYVTGVIPANASPTWGAPGQLACNSCHGNPPSYPQITPEGVADPKANAHKASNHMDIVNSTIFGCGGCHYTTTTDGKTIADPANHANGKYDVVVAPGLTYSGKPVSFTYRPDPGGVGGYCETVSCHGGTTSFWGRWQAYIPAISISFKSTSCFEVGFEVSEMLNAVYPITYTWDFGDGYTEGEITRTQPISTSAPISTSHTYANGTARTVTISGRDNSKRYFKKSQTFTPQPVANQAPTANWKVATIDRYTVTVTDLSFDPDYNTCGTGPGTITINWQDQTAPYAPTIITASINLTDSPSNVNYSFMYSAALTNKTYYPTHSIKDNFEKPPVIPAANLSVTVPGLTSIGGKITLSGAGAGVADLSIKLLHMDKTLITTATTGADGSFSFPAVKYYDQFLIVDPNPAANGYAFLRTISCPWYYSVPTYMSCVFTNTNEVNFTATPSP
jgi:predicted CxxxxCH...CXXCH cytochrome family protein